MTFQEYYSRKQLLSEAPGGPGAPPGPAGSPPGPGGPPPPGGGLGAPPGGLPPMPGGGGPPMPPMGGPPMGGEGAGGKPNPVMKLRSQDVWSVLEKVLGIHDKNHPEPKKDQEPKKK